MRILVLAGALLAGSLRPAGGQECELVVHPDQILRSGADRVVGINLNYIRDHDENRPQARPIQQALSEMGARWLRFPGGEKSDFHLWASPPYLKAESRSQGWYTRHAGRRMNFDEYMALARAVRAEPCLVAAYDSEKRTQTTRQKFLELAVAWVRYANVEKKYGVKYWEIGNENWHNETARPEEMAEIVAEFARAMKAADPAIRIGSNGSNPAWWAAFLPRAAPHLDFVSVSLYNTSGWHGYDYYPRHPEVNLIGTVTQALKGIDQHAPEADRKRIQVVVAETNSKDFAKDRPWSAENSLGHALVTCDTIGKLLLEPRVASAMLWTTRWMKDDEAPDSQWYALDSKNRLTAAGHAVAIWGRFARERMVAVSGQPAALSAFATRGADGRALNVIVINKGYEPVAIGRVILRPPGNFTRAAVFRLSGSGPDDRAPKWEELPALRVKGGAVAGLTLPGVSATVLSLGGE